MVFTGLLSACGVSTDNKTLSEQQNILNKNVDSYETQFQIEYQRFIPAYFTAVENKQRFEFLLESMNQNLSEAEHLSSLEQAKVEEILKEIKSNWDELSTIAIAMDAYKNLDSKVAYDIDKPTTLLIAEGIDWFSYDLVVSINPDDKLGQLFIARNKLWLVARVTLFDAYLVNLVKYTYRDEGRRQFEVGDIDAEAGQFVEEMYEEIVNQSMFEETLDTILLIKAMPESVHLTNEHEFLNKVLANSYAYQRLPTLSNFEQTQIAIDITSNQFEDGFYEFVDDAVFVISQGVGNVSGLFESREGKLKGMAQKEIDSIIEELQPLDILLEKTPFRLTDSFIPGHWGHVAIWVGGKQAIPELKRLGVWDELPRLEAYARAKRGYQGPSFQAAIQSDQSIVEALREGVEINNLSHFLNVDDLAVVRANQLTDEQKRRYLLHTFAQVGKPYDFNFDVETNNEIVCSELIFESFNDVSWPVEKTVGRYTISPDNVAVMAVGEDALFSPTIIYHDGLRLNDLYHQQNFKLLLEQKYEQIISDSTVENH